MRTPLHVGFNVLAVCFTTAFAGVMLEIGLGFGQLWLDLPPSEFQDWFAQNNPHVSRANPFVIFPALLG